jgi:dihydrofolate reductase
MTEVTMARLIYTALCSLDGYTNDKSGGFGWAAPDEEVHRFVNDHERTIGTYLYGRRLYDVMAWWETLDFAGQPQFSIDYALIWRAADKIVYSRTLDKVASARTRIEQTFDPAAIQQIKATATRDISIGGATLASAAIRAGLVDELHLFLSPIVVGGGTRALPDDVRWDLELRDEHRFGNGVIHVHYGAKLR